MNLPVTINSTEEDIEAKLARIATAIAEDKCANIDPFVIRNHAVRLLLQAASNVRGSSLLGDVIEEMRCIEATPSDAHEALAALYAGLRDALNDAAEKCDAISFDEADRAGEAA